jgi:hypothetical protein
MAESAVLLVDDVLPHEPIRQWVLSFPFQLRFLFASYPQIMGKVLSIVYRTLATHITKKQAITNRRHRVTITPAKRNKAKQALPAEQEKTQAHKHQSMTWAQRLKRVVALWDRNRNL